MMIALSSQPSGSRLRSELPQKDGARCSLTRFRPTVCQISVPDCCEKLLAVVGWMAPAMESALVPAPPEPITTPEDTLRRAGISSERQAVYQRRMSSLLAGRG